MMFCEEISDIKVSLKFLKILNAKETLMDGLFENLTQNDLVYYKLLEQHICSAYYRVFKCYVLAY